MSETRKIVEECESCGYGPVEATACKWPHGPHHDRKPVWMCDFCRGTRAGNAHLYPSNTESREHGVTLQTIAACANIIVEKLRAGRTTLGG